MLSDFLRTGLVAASPLPRVLATIGGYELLRLLGAGGMGVVFLARPTKALPASEIPPLVVMKLLKPCFLTKPSFQQWFLREAVRMSRMSHPNLLPVLEISPQASASFSALYLTTSRTLGCCPVLRTPPSYFVTPYIAAGSLGDWLARSGPFPVPLFLRAALPLAGVLSYLHTNGLVHRDVKPANILMDVHEHLYLADLGLATTVAETAVFDGCARSLVGTPAYLSPALAAGEAEDTRADIYAFGAVCYEVLSGRPPYAGNSSQEVLSQVKAGPPQALGHLAPCLPSALIRIVEGAMARQIRYRYSSMADILADLHAFQRDANVAGSAIPAACAHGEVSPRTP